MNAEPSSAEAPHAGKRIAQICNRMQLTNDTDKRFGLSRRRPQKTRSGR